MAHKNSKGMFFDKKEEEASHEGKKSDFGRAGHRGKKRKARHSTRK